MTVKPLKTLLHKIDHTFLGDRITVDDIQKGGDPLYRKIEHAMTIEGRLNRIQMCKTAGHVFQEFAVDAAAAKVSEAFEGRTSEARQRAQETILEYALGKPINRTLSFSGRISESTDEELEHDIGRLLVELGFSAGKGTTSSIFMGTQGSQRQVETTPVQTQSGVSDELHKFDKEN